MQKIYVQVDPVRQQTNYDATMRNLARSMGIPDERYMELLTLARDQIIAETGNYTMYDVLRRAADLVKNS